MRKNEKDHGGRKPLAVGELVGHYKVVRLVGRGGVGEVYLARDTRLGRRVALKLVHLRKKGGGADLHQAVEDFLSEARITARFNHPHIVTVYTVDEHQGHPYVALEYLEGQSLRERLHEERPGLKESARIGLAIADALVEAHRNQILHRDLKPENVMLPKDGRLRVVDFGLATVQTSMGETGSFEPPPGGESLDSPREVSLTSQRTTHVVGTPRYIAPEVWKGLSFSTASDIWALGMILHELFSGRHPYKSLTRVQLFRQVRSDDPVPPLQGADDLPQELVELVDRCVDKDPDRRASTHEVADTLRRFLALSRQPLPEEVSPFRGLLPFTEREADMFFGRDDEIGAFLERLRVTPVAPVVGPSGAGKSSFVQAGVIPRLRDRGHWTTLLMRPGQNPFRALANSLSKAGGYLQQSTVSGIVPIDLENEVAAMEAFADEGAGESESEALERQLVESPGRLALVLQQLVDQQRSRVLLIVDQLEELYTLVEDDEVRRGFMRAICTAADDEQAPVRVIFTLRDDFIGRLAETTEAREALSHVTVLSSPGPEALQRILTKPLQRVGYRYDAEALVERMIRAIQGEMAGLPVLQFALSQLWERRDRDRRVLTTRAYDGMGGIAGALAGHADGILGRLTPTQMRVARGIFLSLVTPRATRQIVTRQELLERLGQQAAEVLDILTRERVVLVRKAHSDADAEAELELVHESLINNWKRLARWIDESREEIAFLAEIGQAAELWEKRGQSNHEVWRGPALQEAELKITRCATVPGQVQAFMNASRRLARRRVRRRRVAVAIVMIALAVVGIVFAVKEREVRQQREHAEIQREQAEIQRSEAQREGALAALLRDDLLEARAKLRRALETQDSPLARMLWWRLSRNPLLWQKNFGANTYDVSFTPNGESVAVACQDHSVYLVDVRTNAIQVLRGQGDQILCVGISPDSERLAAGTWGGQIWLWDLETRAAKQLKGHERGVLEAKFSPDGALLATCGQDGDVRLWDGRTGAERGVLLDGEKRIRGLSFSPDGKLLAAGGCDNSVRLFELASKRELAPLLGHEDCITDLTFSPDGNTLVSASHDKTVRAWDVAAGKLSRVLSGHTATVQAVAVDAAGKTVASGGIDETIRLWDLESGEQVRMLHGHTNRVYSLDFSPTGGQLASGGLDAALRLWDTTTAATHDERRGHEQAIYRTVFCANDELVVSAARDGTARVWSVASGLEQDVLTSEIGPLYSVAVSPDDSIMATAAITGEVVLWNMATGEKTAVLNGHKQTVHQIIFARGGTELITASSDDTIRIWDVASGTQKRMIRERSGLILDSALSPDEQILVSGSANGAIQLWNPESREEIGALEGHANAVWGVAFGPQGRRLLSGAADKTIRLWDLESKQSEVVGEHQSRVYAVRFHPDGSRFGSSSADGTARIWNLKTGDHTVLRGHRAEVNDFRFSSNGELAVTASDDGTIRLWDVETGRSLWRAPLLIADPPQLFTHLGWVDLDSSSAAEVDHASWRRTVAERARSAAATPDDRLLCVATHDDELQLWDRQANETIRVVSLPGLTQVLAVSDRCLALAGDKARLFGRDGPPLDLASQVTAAALDDDRILLAAADEVLVFGSSGERRTTHKASAGATALARVGEWLALGYKDGNIEIYPTAAGVLKPSFAFEQVPSSPAVRMIEGPMGTVVAGYANGLWGIWNLDNGARLYDARVHGPVVHLLLQRGKLYAASELGQYSVLDVSMFDRDYCELLREVWKKVPVTWASGLPVLSAPPDDHPCRRAAE